MAKQMVSELEVRLTALKPELEVQAGEDCVSLGKRVKNLKQKKYNI